MAFGIGTNAQKADAGTVKGGQMPIACECWFTSSGKTTPVMIKVQNEEDGEIITIRNIQIHYSERKNYAGIPSDEFDCSIYLLGQKLDVKLIHYLTENKWTMNFR